MNELMEMPAGLGVMHVGEMLAAPTLQRETAAKQSLTVPAGKALRSISNIVDGLVTATIEKKTAAEFRQTRKELFPSYFTAVRALSDVARIVVPRHTLEVLAANSFSEAEADFRENGITKFGTDVRDQAMFTIWTLRKISDLCQKVDKAGLPPSLSKADSELHEEFVYYALWSRFHLDCLRRAMQSKQPLFPEVLDVIMDGLRGAVNAYTWVRRALDLRSPVGDLLVESVEWDEEDEALMNEADRELIPEP